MFETKFNKVLLVVIALIIMFICGVYFAKNISIKFANSDNRFITVKGLAEMEVKANKGVWVINFGDAGNDVQALQNKTAQDTKIIIDFLKNGGFADEEITIGRQSIVDKTADRYATSQIEGPRYIINATVTLSTDKVDGLDSLSRKTGDLISKGVLIREDWNVGAPVYFFTKINDIKSELITLSTKQARISAESFAADSGAVIVGIKNAAQGQIDIQPLNNADPNDNSDIKYINKKVRVITTISYLIK